MKVKFKNEDWTLARTFKSGNEYPEIEEVGSVEEANVLVRSTMGSRYWKEDRGEREDLISFDKAKLAEYKSSCK